MFTSEGSQMRLPGGTAILADFNAILPSSRYLVLSVLFILALVTTARLAPLLFSRLSILLAASDAEEKGSQEVSEVGRSYGVLSKPWEWLRNWEGFPPSLPVSLSMSETEMIGSVGKGMGIGLGSGAPRPNAPSNWQLRRSGPSFEHPLPAVYQSEIPASMAKMIMSRHTLRRPNQRPPPRAPSSRRCQSMV